MGKPAAGTGEDENCMVQYFVRGKRAGIRLAAAMRETESDHEVCQGAAQRPARKTLQPKVTVAMCND